MCEFWSLLSMPSLFLPNIFCAYSFVTAIVWNVSILTCIVVLLLWGSHLVGDVQKAVCWGLSPELYMQGLYCVPWPVNWPGLSYSQELMVSFSEGRPAWPVSTWRCSLRPGRLTDLISSMFHSHSSTSGLVFPPILEITGVIVPELFFWCSVWKYLPRPPFSLGRISNCSVMSVGHVVSNFKMLSFPFS